MALVEEVALVAAQREIGEGVAARSRHQALRLAPLTVAARGTTPRRSQNCPGDSCQDEHTAHGQRSNKVPRELAAGHHGVLADHAPAGLTHDPRPRPGEMRGRGMPDQGGHAVAEDDGQGNCGRCGCPGRPASRGRGVELRAPVPEAEQQQDRDEGRRHVDVPQQEQPGGGGAEHDGRQPGAVLPARQTSRQEEQPDGHAHDQAADDPLRRPSGDERRLQSGDHAVPRAGGRRREAETGEHGRRRGDQARHAGGAREAPRRHLWR